MSRFLRKGLRGVAPYVPGEQPRDRDVVKLNTNENPYPASPRVLEALRALDAEALRKYSDPLWTGVREVASRVFDIPADCIAAGNGSDELLRLCLTAFVDPGETVVVPDITYSLYETLIRIHGARCVTIPLDAELRMPEALITAEGSLLFLCHPNAPTGVSVPREYVERLVESFAGVVVIDEAYADFADHHFLDLAGRRPNVLVLRTLSKAYSLAGMRIGLAFGDPELIRALELVKDSYNLSVSAQVAASAALEDQETMRRNCAHVRETRARVEARLRDLGLRVYPSQTNFLLVRLASPEQARGLQAHLRAAGLLVRYFDRPRLESCLRISVGTDAQVDRLIEAVAAFLDTD